MRIVDPETFEERPERHVGELLIRGTSVTPGYYKRPDATAELFRDGWLCTGDLAYLLDGELVLCGRIKDVIIVGGRNVFPEDIERAVGVLDGVRAGNVIAFGMEGYKGKESVVVVAEITRRRPRRDPPRHPPPHARGVRAAAARRDARPAEHAAEDVVGQAAAGEVPRALPRGAARAGVMRGLRVRSPPPARPRARDRVVGAAGTVRAPRSGRGDPRRAGGRRPLRHQRAAADRHGADRGRARRRARALPRVGVAGVPARRAARSTTSSPTCSPCPACAPGWARAEPIERRRPARVVVLRDDDAADSGDVRRRPFGRRLRARRDRRRARRRARRLRAVPAAGPPRHDVAVRRLLLLQQRGDRRRARRRGDRWSRSPCSTSTTTTATGRSRSSTSATTSPSCRCTATRCGRTRTTPASPTRPGAGRGSGSTCNVPLPAGTDDDAYLAALDPALAAVEAVAPGRRRRLARRRHVRRRPDVRPGRSRPTASPAAAGPSPRSAARWSCCRRVATPTTPSAPTSEPGSSARRSRDHAALISASTFAQRSGSLRYGRVERDAVDDVAVAAVQLRGDLPPAARRRRTC